MPDFRRYAARDADNARWEGFAFRPGDIVISAPSKSGTTWTQLLCALVVFDGPNLPAPLSDVSPWLDMKTAPIDDVRADLERQTHRRFIKTHTPVDGLPSDDRVTYLCIGRDPRDAAVSMVHHQQNMDRARLHELLAAAGHPSERPVPPPVPAPTGDDLRDRLRLWMDQQSGPGEAAETLEAILRHLDLAWRVRDRSNVALFHFGDYLANLPGELARLAEVLDLSVPERRIEELAAEASIDRARGRAAEVAPYGTQGLWRDPARFFRSGGSGEWRSVFTADDDRHYRERVAQLVDPELAEWAHHGRFGAAGERR